MKLPAKGSLLGLDVDVSEHPGSCQNRSQAALYSGTECQLCTGPPHLLSFTTAPLISPRLHFRAHESLRNEF